MNIIYGYWKLWNFDGTRTPRPYARLFIMYTLSISILYDQIENKEYSKNLHTINYSFL